MQGRGETPRGLAILPARLGSTRLPRKVLLADTGRPLVVHTAEAVSAAERIERVLVATDDEEVLNAVRQHGYDAVMTRADHASGTDRVHEAAGDQDGYDVIVNVQADEPEIDAAELDRLVAAFEDETVEAATLAAPITDPAEEDSPSVVKVVRDQAGDALYFSRSPLPSRVHARPGFSATTLRHVGVYAFRPAALNRFCSLPEGALERAENLEQLRWLEAGRRMRVLDAKRAPRGIDTEADYEAFVTRMGGITT